MATMKSKLHNINLVENIESISSNYDLLINATPSKYIGPLKDLFIHASMIFDLVVSPEETEVIAAAKSLDKSFITGIEMTKYQFQKQFLIYTGVEIHIEEIDSALTQLFLAK